VPVRIVGETTAPLPSVPAVRHEDAAVASAAQPEDIRAVSATGTIEIKMGGARVRISGTVDAAALGQVLTHLGRRS
jgi:hypothetical protein